MDPLNVALLVAVGILILTTLSKYLSNQRRKSIIRKWSEMTTGRKVVILHGMYGNSSFLPTPSPFVLKLETFLRYANIEYEVDRNDIWGPKGKTPWISYGQHHMGDSQLIVEFLKTKFEIPDVNYTDKDLAVGTLLRIAIEEHLYWCGVMWRFAFGGRETLQNLLDRKSTFLQWAIFKMIAPTMKSMCWSQGIGRHSESEVIQFMLKDLRCISVILGNKQFLLGDHPTEDDCAVFAGLASAVFMPDSPIKSHLEGELRNLKEYTWRMREKYWPDWKDVISNGYKRN